MHEPFCSLNDLTELYDAYVQRISDSYQVLQRGQKV